MRGCLWWKLPDAIPVEKTSNLHTSEFIGAYPEKFHCIWRSRTVAFDLNLKMASVSHVLKKWPTFWKVAQVFKMVPCLKKGPLFIKLACQFQYGRQFKAAPKQAIRKNKKHVIFENSICVWKMLMCAMTIQCFEFIFVIRAGSTVYYHHQTWKHFYNLFVNFYHWKNVSNAFSTHFQWVVAY